MQLIEMVEKTRTGLVPIVIKETDSRPPQEYWTLSFGQACRNGWSCRSCRKAISKGEQIAVRDGRKLRLSYHIACFEGEGDPRTQPGSSYFEGRLPVSTSHAPQTKGAGKWSVKSYGYLGQ